MGGTQDSQAVANTALVVRIVAASEPARHLQGQPCHITLHCGHHGEEGVAYMLVCGPPTADQRHVEPCESTDQDKHRQYHHHQHTPGTWQSRTVGEGRAEPEPHVNAV